MNAKNFTIVDKKYSSLSPNYFKTIFFRKEELKPEISLGKWVWLCVLEVLFGAELLENLAITSSVSGCPEEPDPKREYGLPQQLSLHIPAGIFTSLFHNQILQLLYYKYYLQYLLILPVSHPYIDEAKAQIHVERVRFRLRKSLLYQFIAFRRIYIAIAIALSLCFNIVAYFISDSLSITVIFAATLEAVRRLFKI